MSTSRVRLPDSLHKEVRELAEQEQTSLNQIITAGLVEKIAALMTEGYLQARAQRASRQEFQKAMAKVPHRKPLPGDDLKSRD